MLAMFRILDFYSNIYSTILLVISIPLLSLSGGRRYKWVWSTHPFLMQRPHPWSQLWTPSFLCTGNWWGAVQGSQITIRATLGHSGSRVKMCLKYKVTIKPPLVSSSMFVLTLGDMESKQIMLCFYFWSILTVAVFLIITDIYDCTTLHLIDTIIYIIIPLLLGQFQISLLLFQWF